MPDTTCCSGGNHNHMAIGQQREVVVCPDNGDVASRTLRRRKRLIQLRRRHLPNQRARSNLPPGKRNSSPSALSNGEIDQEMPVRHKFDRVRCDCWNSRIVCPEHIAVQVRDRHALLARRATYTHEIQQLHAALRRHPWRGRCGECRKRARGQGSRCKSVIGSVNVTPSLNC